mgnify:CR=1 FL=1
MADEDDGLAHFFQCPDVFAELLRLLRRQDGGGLVQNDILRVTHQHLQDLDALLLAHRHAAHGLLRVQLDAVCAARLLNVGQRRRLVDGAAPAGWLGAHNGVLPDLQRGHQHEMLIHHADTAGAGVLRAAQLYRPAVQTDLARGGLQRAAENIHQGGLSRTVLAHDGVYRALFEGDVHILQCELAKEVLGDPAHGDSLHIPCPFMQGPAPLRWSICTAVQALMSRNALPRRAADQ